MPSYKKIQMDSPRFGIMKSAKNIDEDKPKEEKQIKICVIESKKTVSIHENNSVSLDNHENATQKGEIVTVKLIPEPPKKGCLKNGDHLGFSLKKIVAG